MKYILLLILISCGDCDLSPRYRGESVTAGRQIGLECESKIPTHCGYTLVNCQDGNTYTCVQNVREVNMCRTPASR